MKLMPGHFVSIQGVHKGMTALRTEEEQRNFSEQKD